MPLTAYRAALLYSLDDPARSGANTSYCYHADGLLLVDDGHIQACGPANALLPSLPADIPVEHWPGRLILPGLIDCHLHYAQTAMIGSGGLPLLDWLQHYTWPAEQKLADPGFAAQLAQVFIAELLRNGTTTAMVFPSVHAHSVDALFQAASALDMRLLCGKVLMDRNAPPSLLDSAQEGHQQSRTLIERWHGHGRMLYAVTPRFAGSCSPRQLQLAGRLLQEYPGLYLQTHLAENREEVAWMRQLFPECRSYLDIYARHGLLGPRSMLAHAIHLDEQDCSQLAASGAAVAFCPSSNLFLGSGLFDLARAERFGIAVGIGSDIGAGTSFSLLRNLDEAAKIGQLQGQPLDPFKALYLATLGAARALQLQDRIGSLQPGHEADFIILDPQATPLLRFRLEQAGSLREQLAVLLTLGDDRVVEATFIAGQCRHRRDG